MPIYDYQCQSCQFKSEVMRKISAPSTETCPQCGAETFSKQLSAPSFQLSGSGWYATDFKNSGNKTSTSAGTEKSEASSEKPDEKKSESTTTPCKTGCACH